MLHCTGAGCLYQGTTFVVQLMSELLRCVCEMLIAGDAALGDVWYWRGAVRVALAVIARGGRSAEAVSGYC